MQERDFNKTVTLICKEDTRFDRRAYDFVRLGLDRTVKELQKKERLRKEKPPHVTGPELLEGLRAFALEQFGPMTKTVLNDWGIRRCRDFGDIVYNLIEWGVFLRNEKDRLEDFS